MRRWPYTFAVCLSIAVGLTAVVASSRLGVPLRDPDGAFGHAYVRLPVIVLLFFAVGVIPMAIRRSGLRGSPAAARDILREEWNLSRVVHIATGLLSFYICYVSYRNLKTDLPLVRNQHFDKQMLDLDNFLAFGNDPARLLHDLLGTTFAAQALSVVYVAYLPIIPLTLGAILVWRRDLTLGAWYATALSLNWVLGVVSYYILPTLGPAFYEPQRFSDLPQTSAASLQRNLFHAATRFYDDPAGGATYGIAGFASLHVSVIVSACLFARATRQRNVVQIVSWVYLGLVVLATVYFGWHYIADDVFGALIGWVAVWIGAWASGNRVRRRRQQQQPEKPPAVEHEPAR